MPSFGKIMATCYHSCHRDLFPGNSFTLILHFERVPKTPCPEQGTLQKGEKNHFT